MANTPLSMTGRFCLELILGKDGVLPDSFQYDFPSVLEYGLHYHLQCAVVDINGWLYQWYELYHSSINLHTNIAIILHYKPCVSRCTSRFYLYLKHLNPHHLMQYIASHTTTAINIFLPTESK